mgnify:CR=1 FL=1
MTTPHRVSQVYSLYDTLNKRIPERKLKKREVARLETTTMDPAKQEAAFLLIIESAIRYDGYDPSTAKELPYAVKYRHKKGKDRVKVDIAGLPHELQWVLYKFLDVGA